MVSSYVGIGFSFGDLLFANLQFLRAEDIHAPMTAEHTLHIVIFDDHSSEIVAFLSLLEVGLGADKFDGILSFHLYCMVWLLEYQIDFIFVLI